MVFSVPHPALLSQTPHFCARTESLSYDLEVMSDVAMTTVNCKNTEDLPITRHQRALTPFTCLFGQTGRRF